MKQVQDDYPEDEITKKMCLECNGEGVQRWETVRSYRVETCRWCKGSGRVPMSGNYPKTNA